MSSTRARHSAADRASLSPLAGKIVGGVLAAVLALFSFGSWAFSSAVGSAPDDDYHLSSIWCSSFAGDTCEVDPGGEGVFIPESLREGIYCYYHNPNQSAGCQPFMDGTDPRPDVPFAHNNPIRNLYPDGYYQFSSLFKTPNIQATVLTIRFVNLGIFLSLAFAVFLLLPNRLRTVWVWTWAIGLVPMGMFIIPSTNPSSWGIIAVATGWMALLGYLETRGPKSWALGGLYLLSAVIAVSARVDAVLYLGFASVIAVWLSSVRGVDLIKKIWIGLVGVLFVVVQLIINPANLARVVRGIGQRSDRYADPLPWTQSQEVIDGTAFDWSLLWNNFWNVPGLWLGVFGGYPWGSLGWIDTAVPQLVLASTLMVFAGVAFLGIRGASAKKIAALIASLAALWFMPLYLLQLGGFLAGEEVQPRYLLPLMLILIGVINWSPSGQPIITERGRLWFIVIALTLANAIALHTNIRRYTTGIRVQGLNLDSPREWWWPFMPEVIGPNLVWIIGSLTFGALLWLLLIRIVPSLDLSQAQPKTMPVTAKSYAGSSKLS